MLQLFRINDPYRIVLIFVFLIIIRTIWLIYGLPIPIFGFKWQLIGSWLAEGNMMYADCYDYTGPLSAFVYKWLAMTFGTGRWVHITFSTLLILLQAALLNDIFLKNKAYHENTYVLAFIYIVVMSGIMDFYMLSPQLMAITFIIISINNLFRRIDNQATDEMFLTSGIHLGLATFFYLPSVIFLVSYLISFLLFSTAIARRLILLSVGSAMIYLVVWGYFFWYGGVTHFHQSFFLDGLSRFKNFHLSYLELIIQLGAILVASVFSFSIFFTSRFSNIQQKIQRVMLIFLITAILCAWISPDLSGTEVILAVPSIAFFLTHYFLLLRRKWTRLIIPHFFILIILAFPFFWMNYFKKEEMFIDKEKGRSTDKRIMVIGEDINLYHGNIIASPFLDEYIGKRRMEGLRYYQESTEIFDIMQDADADIIIDQWGYFPRMVELFPQLGTDYAKEDGIYAKISN